MSTQIDFYNSRINFFYGSKIEKVNFGRIQNEITARLNEKNELVTSKDQDRLETDSPLSIITGNAFEVDIKLGVDPPASKDSETELFGLLSDQNSTNN